MGFGGRRGRSSHVHSWWRRVLTSAQRWLRVLCQPSFCRKDNKCEPSFSALETPYSLNPWGTQDTHQQSHLAVALLLIAICIHVCPSKNHKQSQMSQQMDVRNTWSHRFVFFTLIPYCCIHKFSQSRSTPSGTARLGRARRTFEPLDSSPFPLVLRKNTSQKLWAWGVESSIKLRSTASSLAFDSRG